MLLPVIITVCWTIVSSANVPELEIPEGVEICVQDDPNLNECLGRAVKDLLPKIRNGIKGVRIPPIDPLVIPKLQVNYNEGNIQGSIIVKGIETYGLSGQETKILNVKISDRNFTSEFEILLPRVIVKGTYKGGIKINGMGMNAGGYFNATITKAKILVNSTATFKIIKGEKHLHFKNIDVIPDVSDFKFYASGILPDPQLNSFALDLVNQHWRDIYKEVITETKSYWERIVIKMANEFHSTVPFKKLIKIRE